MSSNAPGRRPGRVLSTLAVTAALVGIAAGPAQAVQPNAGDLDFILEQYDRSQPHALSGNAADLRAQVPQAELPYGLRTVNGELNNLIPGREKFGAADRVMPRLLQKT